MRPTLSVLPGVELIRVFHVFNARMAESILSLIHILEIGKQMLITRGALTTFSFANDLAKYFAIIPAMFAGLFVADGMSSGPLSALNIMGLNSPQSAILSTVIFKMCIRDRGYRIVADGAE